MLDYDKILKEVSYRVPSGIPNFLDNHDLYILEEVLKSNGVSPSGARVLVDELQYKEMEKYILSLDEGMLDKAQDMWDAVKNFISTSWEKLKSFIVKLMDGARKQLGDDFEKRYEFVIPTSITEAYFRANNLLVEGGATPALRGTYNELLVVKMIYDMHTDDGSSGVRISKDCKPFEAKVDKLLAEKLREIHKLSKKKADLLIAQAKEGSKAMVNYLVNEAKTPKDGDHTLFIVGAEHTAVGDAKDKSDIKIYVENGLDPRVAEKYSMKLYEGTKIGLNNTGLYPIVAYLSEPDQIDNIKIDPKTGKSRVRITYSNVKGFPEVKKVHEMMSRLKADAKIGKQFADFSKNEKEMNALKKEKEDGTISQEQYLHKRYGPKTAHAWRMKEAGKITDEQYAEVEREEAKDPNSLHYRRKVSRSPINKIYTDVFYKWAHGYVDSGSEVNRRKFKESIMTLCGLSKNAVKMLMAIVDGKSDKVISLRTAHPDVVLDDIHVDRSPGNTVAVQIKNGEVVVFEVGFKEGGKTIVSASFEKVPTVDPSMFAKGPAGSVSMQAKKAKKEGEEL